MMIGDFTYYNGVLRINIGMFHGTYRYKGSIYVSGESGYYVISKSSNGISVEKVGENHVVTINGVNIYIKGLVFLRTGSEYERRLSHMMELFFDRNDMVVKISDGATYSCGFNIEDFKVNEKLVKT